MVDEDRAPPEDGFGQLLRKHRQAAGLTQEALGVEADLSARAISNIERGRSRGPHRRSVEALASALGLPYSDRATFLDAARRGRQRVESPDGRSDFPAAARLVGREVELARLTELGDGPADGSPSGTRVVTISGLPGVGKTSLALAAADRIASRYPGTRFFVDLRGTDQDPLPPATALDRMLRALGVADARIPESLDERAGLFRSLLHGRNALIVLDNAADEEQVRPLLPGEGGCFVLVTSRRVLAGVETAARVLLDVLPPEDAVRLFARIIGTERARAEWHATHEVAELCGHLPLALRIAGNRLVTRPQWTVNQLAYRLGDQQRQLTELSAGDVRVRAAFEMSYRQLDPTARRVFRRLSLVPGPDFAMPLVAVVAGIDRAAAEEAVDTLVDVNLLQPAPSVERYRFHDLLRAFAGEVLDEQEPETARRTAAAELASWLVATATEASNLFNPDTAPSDRSAFADAAEAGNWLDAEAGNWFPIVPQVADAGEHHAVIALARAMHWYSDVRTHPHPWDELFDLGVRAARAVGSRADEAVLLNFLGWALSICHRRFQDGLDTHRAALEVAKAIGDRREQAWALRYIATNLIELGQPEAAVDHCHQAIARFRETGYPLGEVVSRYHLGNALRAGGQLSAALDAHRQARDFSAGLSGLSSELAAHFAALIKDAIGADLGGLGRWNEAVLEYRESGELAWTSGAQWSVGRSLFRQATAYLELGEVGLANERFAEAEAKFVETNDPVWRARCRTALNEMGESSPPHPDRQK